MRTWTLIAAFAAASALPLLVPSSAPADGMGVRDEARPRNPAEKVAPKGSAPMAHAAKAKQGLAVPPPQPSVTITVERGVRMVQLFYGAGQPWDAHGTIMDHQRDAKQSDLRGRVEPEAE